MEVKFIIEAVVIVLALAVALAWFLTQYDANTTKFFEFLNNIPIFSTG